MASASRPGLPAKAACATCGGCRALDGRLAVRGLAAAVDVGDLAEVELELLGDLLQRLAGRALVLDLVVQALDFLVGALLGELVADLALHLVEGALLAGHDLADAHQHDGELALDGLGQLVLLQGEGGLGDLGVDHLAAGEQAELDVGFLEAELGRGLGEVLGLGQLGVGLLGGGLVGEGQLLHAPLLRRVDPVLGLLVGRLDLLVDDVDAGLDGGMAQQQDIDLAQLRRHELALVLLVVLAQLGLIQRRKLDQLVEVGGEIVDVARLLAILVQLLDHGLRRHHAGEQAVGDLLADFLAAPIAQEAGLVDAVLAQEALEQDRGELAVRPLEAGLGLDELGDAGVRQGQVQLAGVLVDGCRVDQARERALLDAEQPRLLGRQPPAEAPREGVDLVLVGLPVLVGGDLACRRSWPAPGARPCRCSRRRPRRRRR